MLLILFATETTFSTISIPDGSPLQLTDIIRTSLFHYPLDLNGAEATSAFALSLPGSQFPLLSQGDHPTLGTPSWYVHPCGTAASVEELMKEFDSNGWTEDRKLGKWIDMWFMVLGSMIDFRQ